MEAMQWRWTDERLDDGFDRIDADLRAFRDEVSSFRAETNARFDRLEARLDGWQRAQLQVGAGILVALLGVIATLATKL